MAAGLAGEARGTAIAVYPADSGKNVVMDEALLSRYGGYRGLVLDRFQREAICALDQGFSVLVGAPTGSGKTVVADFIIEKLCREGKRAVYTAPIKTLSMQKFKEFKKLLGETEVGVLTGDVVINPGSPILVMTTEVLRNMILEDKNLLTEISHAIFDEIHYISDEDRGHVWEQCLILLPKPIKILGLSATVPNLFVFCEWLAHVREDHVVAIKHDIRPVPLEHFVFETSIGIATKADLKKQYARYDRSPLGDTRELRYPRTFYYELVGKLDRERLPCLFFVFSRRKCEEYASSSAARIDYLLGEEREEVRAALDEVKQTIKGSQHLEILERCLPKGIAFHHAGLLPPLKRLVEELYERRLVKLLFATETFAVGINYPVRTACFESPTKYDGREFRKLKASEYFQMAGRAGRRGIDEKGTAITLVDAYFHDFGDVPSFSEESVEDLQGNFSLSMNTVLNLASQYGDSEILDIFQKGFDSYRYRELRRGIDERIDVARRRVETLKNEVCPAYGRDACRRVYRRNMGKLKRKRQQLERLETAVPRGKREMARYAARIRAARASIDELQKRVNGVRVERCGGRSRFCTQAYKKLRDAQQELNSLLEGAISLGSPETKLEDYRNRLRLLESKGYISGSKLLPRGLIAQHIHIQELFVTELLADGILDGMDSRELTALAASIDYEPRRLDEVPKRPFFDDYRVYEILAGVTDWEMEFLGYEETVYNEALARAAFAWANGHDFAHVRSLTDADEGSIVLVLRRAIDLLRQIAQAVPGHAQLIEKAREAIKMIDRDIVEVYI
jgi:superfamily II RNA helicase